MRDEENQSNMQYFLNMLGCRTSEHGTCCVDMSLFALITTHNGVGKRLKEGVASDAVANAERPESLVQRGTLTKVVSIPAPARPPNDDLHCPNLLHDSDAEVLHPCPTTGCAASTHVRFKHNTNHHSTSLQFDVRASFTTKEESRV